ncbi:hypothetical protein BJV74DRAFT_768509, partial [Russula compacta]
NNPWKAVSFCYQDLLPQNPPKWMMKNFILITHNIHSLLYKQMACTNFHNH